MPDLELWYPHAIRDYAPANLWGTYVAASPEDVPPKFLLHSTEGGLGVYRPDPPGPLRKYYGHTNWPTYTIAYGAPLVWRVYQHLPANRAARALANRAGGVETNRANVTQVELAGRASEIAVFAATGGMDALAELLAWEHQTRGVPLVSSVRFVGNEGYGEGAPQRLSPSAWLAYTGVPGHQHAPGAEGNSHWDPGLFPIGALLQRAREHLAPPPEEEEEDVPLTEADIRAVAVESATATLALLWERMKVPPNPMPKGWKPPAQADVAALLRRTYEMAGGVWTDVVHTRTAVERLAATATGATGPPPVVTYDAVMAAIDQATNPSACAAIAQHASSRAYALLNPPPAPPTEVAP